jgi:carbonic anhydrase
MALNTHRRLPLAVALAAGLLIAPAFGVGGPDPHDPPAKDSHGAPAAAPKAPAKDAHGAPAAATKAPAGAATKAPAREGAKAPAADPHGAPARTAAPAKDAHGAAAEPAATERPAAKPKAKIENDVPETVTAEIALRLLEEGNARWVSNDTEDPNTGTPRRRQIADKGQKPFVTVLTCADSRLPVERIFDRGAGDVFVIRVAGNVAGASEAGTIEYGLEHLKTPLLVVMGHSKCGAVAAAATGAEVEGDLASIVTRIKPAVERAQKLNRGVAGKDLVPAAVRENVWQSVFDLLKRSRPVREMVKNGEVRVIGAVCELTDGSVEFLGEHPWQSELVAAFEAMDREHSPGAAGHGVSGADEKAGAPAAPKAAAKSAEKAAPAAAAAGGHGEDH